MIEVLNVTKRYGELTAIDRVSFRVEKGEVLAFLGPNGAGKTTTMRILTCFMPATEGTARVAGFDCFDQPQEVKRRVGYLPETPPLYQELTVTEYLTFTGRLKGMSAKDLRNGLDRVVERLSIGDVRHRLIANLSRGYKQRVGLAQALLHDPPVLILDEPTVGLDPKQISKFATSSKVWRDHIRSFSVRTFFRKRRRSASASLLSAAGESSRKIHRTACPRDCADRKKSA